MIEELATLTSKPFQSQTSKQGRFIDMEDFSLIKKQEWYWFITSIMDCDQASVIRCFLAPIYLPYINNDNNNSSYVDEQRRWIDFYEEKITLFYQFNENKDIINKNIFKVMGVYLCERVKQEKGIDCFKYLGKNRNVSQYPERFIYSIFPPNTSKGIFEELWSYYYQLLCQAFKYDTSHIEEKLRKAEEINRNISYFRVPKITTQATDVALQETERTAYLLCTFCVLNSALVVKQQAKNGLLLSDKDDIFEKAQCFLEITDNVSISPKSTTISIEISDLLALNLCAIETDNFELLQIIQSLNEKNTSIVIQTEIDRNQLKEHLLHNIEKSERRLIRLMNSQHYEINKGAQVLMTLTNLEKFWKAIYNKAQEPNSSNLR